MPSIWLRLTAISPPADEPTAASSRHSLGNVAPGGDTPVVAVMVAVGGEVASLGEVARPWR